MRDFLDVKIDKSLLPFIAYPNKLARYLFDRYKLKQGDKFLDIGYGHGEFL